MLTQNEMLRKIEAQENKARSLGAKLWGQKAEVKTTLSLADRKEMPKYGDESVIEPAPWSNVISILFFLGLIVMGYFLGKDMASEPILVRFAFGGFFSLGFIGIIAWLISIHLFGNQLKSSIKVNDKGIELKNRFYQWQDISQTCIVRQPQSKSEFYWLVIGLHNGEINRYDLSQFMGIKEWLGMDRLDIRLANAIEYYKQKRK